MVEGERPQAPYVAKLPKLAHYEIQIGNEGQKSARKEKDSVQLVGLKINQWDAVKQVIRVYGDGTSNEIWMREGVVWQKVAGAAVVNGYTALTVREFGSVEGDVPISSDFSGFEWLSSQLYLGTVTFDGKRCFAFGQGETKRALISIETRLPELLKNGYTVYRFRYGQPPTSTPQWPEEFEAGWKRYQAIKKTMYGTSGPR
jgi:hypothetical protein